MNQAKHILVTAPLGVGGITSMMINIQKNIDREKINFDYLVLHDRHEDLEDVVIKMGSKKLIASADEISNKWLDKSSKLANKIKIFMQKSKLEREKMGIMGKASAKAQKKI